ncbi:MAG: hypothetical protein HY319_27545 [Armatimonadetes bacterium]|nr:hypothetical protein [Armatimonadota bacterium]
MSFGGALRGLLGISLLALWLGTSGCGGGTVDPIAESGAAGAGSESVLARGGKGGGGGPPPPSKVPQASLSLASASTTLGHKAEKGWSLEKTGARAENTVSWSVAAREERTGPPEIVLSGYLKITNSGEGPAPLGNLVINLQRRQGKRWVTVSSQVADATLGEAATSAKVVPAACSEGSGVVYENNATGRLRLMDAERNSLFCLSRRGLLPGGESLGLLYSAVFKNDVLMIPAGEELRAEVIVTFGNAGARGRGGASGSRIDINGNGQIDPAEISVRSVPDRQSRCLPPLRKCYEHVLVSDRPEDLATTGTVTTTGWTTDLGAGSGVQVICGSRTFSLQVQAEPGEQGGEATNTAHLFGKACFIHVVGPIDPATGKPICFTIPCCPGLRLVASNTQTVPPAGGGDPPGGFEPGDYRSQTQGGWGSTPNGQNPGAILAGNFAQLYPAGIEIGIPGETGFSARFTAAPAIEGFLPQGGPSAALTADLTDPTSSAAGVFGGQVLALRLNVDFSQSQVAGFPAGIGDLTLVDTGTSLDGLTVRQVLAAAEQALGGGQLPESMGLDDLNEIASNLNEAFVDGTTVSSFAQQHLTD